MSRDAMGGLHCRTEAALKLGSGGRGGGGHAGLASAAKQGSEGSLVASSASGVEDCLPAGIITSGRGDAGL